MSPEKPAKRWGREGVDRALAMLPVVEAEGFVAATWPAPKVEVVDGVPHTQMPYPDYHPVVQTLWEIASEKNGAIDPYATLPEDPTPDGAAFSVREVRFTPEYFGTATVDQVGRYLVFCTRGERFCDGYIAAQFHSGTMLAALRRLRELRNAMAPEESP